MYQLINKQKKLAALLKEYKAAQIFEKCLYHVTEQADRKGWFFLVEIKTGQIIKEGTPGKVKSWLNLRKVHIHQVFKYCLLK